MVEKKTHKLHLIDKFFNLIKDGIKTVEIRLNDEKRQKMNIGDLIEFINNDTNESILTEIIDKKVLNSINDLYHLYDEKILGISKKEINNVIYKIYSKEEIEKNGICAIEIIKK